MRHDRIPRVLVVLDPFHGYSRQTLVGIVEYMHQHRPWQIALSHPFGGLPVVTEPARWKGDGAILQSGADSWVRELSRRGLPVVLATSGMMSLNQPRVLPDNEQVGRLAAEHLANCGLASYGYCATSTPSSAARWAGFQERLTALGHRAHTIGLDRSASQLRRWLAALPVPAGVFVFNDTRAARVLALCHQIGRRVPDEIAVLGADNDELLAQLTDPPLSSVDTNSRRVGYQAAALLDRLMRGNRPPVRPVLITPKGVVARRSTDILAVPDPIVRETVSFIRQHINEPLTVARVTAQAHLSARQLQRRFKQALGRTLEQELARARLERACRLLRETTQSLERVAEQAGFRNANQMGALFRRLLRTSPSAHRRHRS